MGLILTSLAVHGQNVKMYVGTYTNEGSQGIYIFNFDAKTGKLNLLNHLEGVTNPSYLCFSRDKKHMYAVEETENGHVSSIAIHPKSGLLTWVNRVKAEGDAPCHVATDKSGKWCFVANYSSGNISVLPIQKDGSLSKAIQTIDHKPKLPNDNLDGIPHAHSVNVAPNNKDIFVCDLGIDKIMHYELDATTGKLSPAKIPYIETKSGAGPRHFAFHPHNKVVYTINELNSTITAFQYKSSTLMEMESYHTLPNEYKGYNSCADIHISPDGKFLYGSNRGHNSIVIFSINPQTGRLSLIGHQSTLGDFPRNFVIDPSGKYLLVANQKSDQIKVFERNKKSGKLKYVNQDVKISRPVCLKFLF
jgi:6-phosphogluconolactonase